MLNSLTSGCDWRASYPPFPPSQGPNNGIGEDFITQLAAKHKAYIVSIEHRFYGQSLPAGGLKRENLPFLSSFEALQDAAQLIDTVRNNGHTCEKWIAFGGSYSGALSAWFRVKFPSRVHAALSSSGVVNALLDFVGFDEQVAEAIGPNCADDVRRTTQAFDTAIAQGRLLFFLGRALLNTSLPCQLPSNCSLSIPALLHVRQTGDGQHHHGRTRGPSGWRPGLRACRLCWHGR